MPQRPRPRNYRKRQQDSDDEEQVGVAEEGGVKEDKESEEDSVRCLFLSLDTQAVVNYFMMSPERSLRKLKSYRNSERNQLE